MCEFVCEQPGSCRDICVEVIQLILVMNEVNGFR